MAEPGNSIRIYTVEAINFIIKTGLEYFILQCSKKNKLTDNNIETDIFTLNKAIQLKELSQRIKLMESEVDNLKSKILAYMKNNKELLYNGLKLANIVDSSYNVFNTERFAEDNPEIYELYKTTQINNNYLSLTRSEKYGKP